MRTGIVCMRHANILVYAPNAPIPVTPALLLHFFFYSTTTMMREGIRKIPFLHTRTHTVTKNSHTHSHTRTHTRSSTLSLRNS